ASSGSVFHGWTGDSGFTGTSSPLNVTIPGANLAPPTSVPYDPITVEAGASFWPAATGLAFSGANAVVAGQVSTAITLSVVDGDGGPTRLTQSTTYTLSSTGFAKFYSDAAGDNPITQITLAPGADISAVTPSQTIFYLNTAAASPQTITASFSSGNNLGTGTHNINVTTGVATMLQVLMPGETAAPGTSTGQTGTPAAQIAGNNIMATINAVDENWNLVSTATPTVKITASDDNAELPDNTALTAGTRTFLVTFKTAGNHTVTATDQSEGESLTENIGSETAVSAGVASKLQILMPGETAAPGTPNGKTGTAADQIAGVAFDLIVNVVDANWNLVTTATGKAAKLTSSDPLSS